MSSGEILVLQHEQDCPPAGLGQWLDARGADWQLVHVAEEPLPAIGRYRAVVVLGSEMSAYDDSVAWVLPEREFVAGCIAVGTPILGICFGGQVLAAATGGKVSKAPRPEFGWTEVSGDEPYGGEWYSWHSDQVHLPEAATILASTAVCVQAFQIGNSLGLQYHPEVTTAEVGAWKAKNAAELQQHYGSDADAAIDARTAEHLDTATIAAARLFASFFDRLGDSGDRAEVIAGQ